MKKIISFAAICALLISCGGNNKNDAVVVRDYPQEEHSGKVVFDEDKPILPAPGENNKKFEVQTIDHYANGDYRSTGVLHDQSLSVALMKSDLSVSVGRFTVSSDGFFSYSGGVLDKARILFHEGGNFEFRDPDGNTYNGNGSVVTPADNPTDSKIKALAGAHWILTDIEATVKGKNITVNFTDKDGINPNDVEKVAEYINKKGASIDLEKVAGYYIKSISLNVSPSKTIIVEFLNGKKAIEGTWAPVLTTNPMTFSYSFNAELDGKLFDAEASGSFEFGSDYKTIVVKVNAKAAAEVADIVIKAKKIQ